MSEHVPAWKRLGLKVTEPSSDPLALIHTLSSSADAILPGQKRKQINQAQKNQKRAKVAGAAGASKAEGDDAPKKAPKRVKVPKAARAPPPESDQLAYLRQYHEDKANWKFSKQKQNWILKNLYLIDLSQYEAALVAYLTGLQGGSKFRIVEECMTIMQAFKKFMEEDDEDEDENKPKSILKKAEGPDSKDKSDIPTEDKAKRAQLLYKSLTGKDFDLGLDDLDAIVEKKEEEKEEEEEEESSSEEEVEEEESDEEPEEEVKEVKSKKEKK